jgi:hypothetical protein
MLNGARDIYLVGSIPLTRPYDVFTTVAELLGERVRRVPDGEMAIAKCGCSPNTRCWPRLRT